MSQQESSHFAVAAQAYYPGQAFNTPAMLQLAASININQGLLLDIGCGDGQLLKLLIERFPDIEMAGLTVSEEERRACGERFDVRVGDMHSLPWQDATFDVVISRHSLEHSISPLTALFEVNRILRLDGVFHVVVPAPVSEWVIKWKDHFSVLHRQMWEKLFDDAGFAVEQYQDGAWLASFSMQPEAEMRFVLRKVRDTRSGRVTSQQAEQMPRATEPVTSVPMLSTLVGRRIVVVLHNLVLFDAIRPVVERFGKDVKFLVPVTGVEGFDAMGERTCDGIIAAGFKAERTALPADIRCDIELSPYPYSSLNVTHAKWRVRFMYGLAKEAWNFSLENNAYYDFVLAYGDYDARVLSAYSTPVRVGNPKIQSVRRPAVRNERPVLLYLPTYGPTSSIEAVSGIQLQLKSRFRVIAKAHHGTTYLEPERTALLQTWVDELAHHDTSLSSLLASADAVLSDGSGAIFDAIAAEVPVAVFQETVWGGLSGTVSLEERLLRDGLISATNLADDIPAMLERALQAGSQPLAALRRELFAALGDEAAKLAAAFLSELLEGAATYETFAAARRTLLAKIAEGRVQREARQAAERQLDEAYRSLTDRLLADVQASLARLTERDGQIAKLSQAISERDVQILDFIQSVAERDGQIAKLNQAITERDEQIVGFIQSAAGCDGQVACLKQTVAERDERISELDELFIDMKNSYSWRLTSPIRFFIRFARHGLLTEDRKWIENQLRRTLRLLPMSRPQKDRLYHWYGRLFGYPLPSSPRVLDGQRVVLSSAKPDYAPEGEGDFVAPESWTRRHESYGVLCLSIIDWDFRIQRPQQLARRFSKNGHPVAYVGLDFAPTMTTRDIEPGVVGLTLPGKQGTNVYQTLPTEDSVEVMASAILSYLQAYPVGQPWVCVVQLPFWGRVAECLRSRIGCPIIYDCMDDHSGFTTNSDAMVAAEDRLLRTSDLVVASSQVLLDRVALTAENVALIRNAVDYDHFSQVPASDIVETQSLRVGYFGAIADWFDSDMVADIARLKPAWRFVLIGSTFSADTKPLEACSNIVLLGEKPYADLPDLIAEWDCCIIPFKRVPLTEATNPVKVYEMLAAGKPVVSVALPELQPIAELGHIALADDAASFVREIEREVGGSTLDRQLARRKYAADNTWEIRQIALDQAIRATYPLVSVIIVSYNNLAINRLCLESVLYDTDYPNYEIIVIDNASTDGTPEYLQGLSHPRLRIILNSDNRGYSGANNQGLDVASGEYLCLLNNDTVVSGSWLSTLVSHFSSDPDIGLVGPVTNAIGNEAKIPVGYRNILDMPEWAEAHCRKYRGKLTDISMLAFFCVVMSRKVFMKVGKLDERFGIGMFEDDDYNRRVRNAGFVVKLALDAFIHHWQRSSFKILGEAAYLETYNENKEKYQAKWARQALTDAESAKLARLEVAAEGAVRTIIFAPSIGWDVYLFQRPHHLAREFARQGYVVVFDCSNSHDQVDMIEEIEPRLFLFKGAPALLTALRNLTLWTFTYNYDYREHFSSDIPVIYDWIDDIAVFPQNQGILEKLHSRAMRDATLVVSVARRLHETAQRQRSDALYLPNAVENGRFEQAPPQNPALEDKSFANLVTSGKPIAGYYGALARWFDYELLTSVAALRPDWEFVLIGPDHDGSIKKSPLAKQTNIHWLGVRDYVALPGYLHLFDVAIIPFKINDITLATSPLKLFEYFAGGRPVVTTPMPECEAFAEVFIADEAEEFARALDSARTAAKDSVYRQSLSGLAVANTWTARAKTVMEALGVLLGTIDNKQLHVMRIFKDMESNENRNFFRALARHLASLADDPCLPMYFRFALSANERGRAVAKLVSKYANLKGARHLDVGCAYGGFLAAFSECGARSSGFDLDPALLALAAENFKDLGCVSDVYLMDVTDREGLSEFRGKFDIITCNDVIEHVSDPELAINSISDMLVEGGLAYFEIPNRDALPFVIADGHYQLFGITLLDNDEAKLYYKECSNGMKYTVGHYLRLPEYRALMDAAGLTFDILPESIDGASLATTLGHLGELEGAFESRLKSVPEAVRGRVGAVVSDYLRQADAALRAEACDQEEQLLIYGASFWKIIARKKATAAQIDNSSEKPRHFERWKHLCGVCNICGSATRFFYERSELYREQLSCEICGATSRYRSIARGLLEALNEMAGVCVGSLADLPTTGVAHRLRIYDTQKPFRYNVCAYPIADYLTRCDWIELHISSYHADSPRGAALSPGVTNQNLEDLTFADGFFDVVITSDVMEHVRKEAQAHSEISRVLRAGGVYIFTVPHNWLWEENLIRVKVSDSGGPEADVHLLEPEYHGDANATDGSGVLAYRAYGRELIDGMAGVGMSLRYDKTDILSSAILNTELFYCKKKC